MCDAKDHARNTYRFYSTELDFKTRRDELRRAEIEQKIARLTPRERELLNILIAGKANKMISPANRSPARRKSSSRIWPIWPRAASPRRR